MCNSKYTNKNTDHFSLLHFILSKKGFYKVFWQEKCVTQRILKHLSTNLYNKKYFLSILTDTKDVLLYFWKVFQSIYFLSMINLLTPVSKPNEGNTSSDFGFFEACQLYIFPKVDCGYKSWLDRANV